ncbi:lactonase family protein [Cerasicoccus arenae]|uniref:lactonase family protein n=1 Tax=Cerasicoccus arenae TaxID=424488 RepID=UPI001673E8FD|nr:lactonase family protein [Cerasicoccus arenae]MBK1859270.1 lactonase family protein [Cerasicoccus arenae]
MTDKPFLLYVGSYTESMPHVSLNEGQGISVFAFSPGDGSLKAIGVAPTINPSYLAFSSSGQYLYSVEERASEQGPAVCAWCVDSRTALPVLINRQLLPGGYPCHLTVSPSGDLLAIACYEEGRVCLLQLLGDGSLGAISQVFQHEGSGPCHVRQKGPHSHMVSFLDERTLLATDLGADCIVVYRRIACSGLWEKQQVTALPKGSGTRHLALHPDGRHVLALGELTGEVTLLRWKDDYLITIDSATSLSAEEAASGKSSSAAIRMSLDGRVVYVSHRASGQVVTLVCDAAAGQIRIKENIPCGGNIPRDIVLSPDNRWLLCAAQDSSAIFVFQRTSDGGLIPAGPAIGTWAGTPVCLAWHPDSGR